MDLLALLLEDLPLADCWLPLELLLVFDDDDAPVLALLVADVEVSSSQNRSFRGALVPNSSDASFRGAAAPPLAFIPGRASQDSLAGMK